jgi:hypothetical protein
MHSSALAETNQDEVFSRKALLGFVAAFVSNISRPVLASRVNFATLPLLPPGAGRFIMQADESPPRVPDNDHADTTATMHP